MLGGVKERLEFLITANADNAIKAFEKTGKVAERELSKTEASLDRTANRMVSVGAGMVATAGVAGAALWKLGGSASDLNESINAVEVAFGAASSGILELSDNAARSVGLTRTEFNGLAVSFKGFATQIASDSEGVVSTVDDMTTRAADFASVFNIDVTQAASTFQSALAGSTEPLRQYGIDLSAASVQAHALSEGIWDGTGAMTEAEKVQARYSLLMQETAFAAGDFANTSDSLANQTKILKAELGNLAADIGTGVLPMMNTAVGVVGSLVGAFSDLPDGAKAGIGSLATLGTVALGTAGSISMVAGQLIKMRERFMVTAADGSRSFNTLGKTTLALSGAMLAAGAAVAIWSIRAASAAERARNLASDFHELNRASDEVIGDAFDSIMRGAVFHFGSVEAATAEFARTNIEAARRVLELNQAQYAGKDVSEELEQAIRNEEEARANAAQTLREYGDATDLSAEQTEELERAQEILRRQAEELGLELEELADSTEGNTDATDSDTATNEDNARSLEDRRRAIDELVKAHDDQRNAARAAADANFNLTREEQRLDEQYQSTIETLFDLEASEREKQIARDEAVLQAAAVADAEVRIAKETAEANGATLSAKEAAEIWNESMARQKELMPGLEADIDAYVEAVNAVPVKTTTELLIEDQQAREAITGIDNELRRLSNLRPTIPVTIQTRGGGGRVPMAFARGTGHAPGGTALVGEEGPELVELPRGSRVYNATDTKRRGHQRASGDTHVYNIHLPVGSDPSAVQRATQRWARRNGRAS